MKKVWQTALVFASATFCIFLGGCKITPIETSKPERVYKLLTRRELASKINANGKVVYIVKDVHQGSKFTADELEERGFEQSKIPIDALPSASLILGRKAKEDMPSGQIICQHDLIFEGKSNGLILERRSAEKSNCPKGTIVCAVKDVLEGSEFTADELKEREVEQASIPVDAMPSISSVVGRKAKYTIKAGELISCFDFKLEDPNQELEPFQ